MTTAPLSVSPSKISRAKRLALDWLVSSGIQDLSSDSHLHGGVSAWYDLKLKSYPFLYGEITGYAINAFLFFHAVTGNSSLVERARFAGDWLIRASDSKYGLPPNRVYFEPGHAPYYDSWVFTFDEWIIVYGLTNLFGVTGERQYLAHAEQIARLLFNKTFLSDGSMYPVFNLATGAPEASNDKWSRQSGSFHAKALFGLNRLFELTGKEEYLSHALRLAKFALGSQKEDGRFVTQTSNDSTHLHPHLYTVEGLYYFGNARENSIFTHAAEKGLEWVLQSELDDGTIYSFYEKGRFVPYVRSDILAQALRLGRMVSERAQRFQTFQTKLDRLREQLLKYQISDGPQKGGFLYGQDQDGSIHEHANTWITMFAAQALWLDEFQRTSNRKYDFRFFV